MKNKGQGGEEYNTCNENRKANWIGHILSRNCLLNHGIEGKVEGMIDVTGRRGRRRKGLLEDCRKDRMLETERGSTRTHCGQLDLQMLRTCCKTDREMKW